MIDLGQMFALGGLPMSDELPFIPIPENEKGSPEGWIRTVGLIVAVGVGFAILACVGLCLFTTILGAAA